MGRGDEIQLEVGENLNYLIYRFNPDSAGIDDKAIVQCAKIITFRDSRVLNVSTEIYHFYWTIFYVTNKYNVDV